MKDRRLLLSTSRAIEGTSIHFIERTTFRNLAATCYNLFHSFWPSIFGCLFFAIVYLTMASPSRSLQQPGTGIPISKLGTDKIFISPRSPDDDEEQETGLNVPKPQSPCFSTTSDEVGKENSYSECSYPSGAVLAEVTDDGYNVVESIDGVIRSDSSYDESEPATSPLLERLKIVKIADYTSGQYDTNWETESDSESNVPSSDPGFCNIHEVGEMKSQSGSTEVGECHVVSDSESESDGYWLPLESMTFERMQRRDHDRSSLTVFEDDDESDYFNTASASTNKWMDAHDIPLKAYTGTSQVTDMSQVTGTSAVTVPVILSDGFESHSPGVGSWSSDIFERAEREVNNFKYKGLDEESLGSDLFEEPESQSSFANSDYSDVIPSSIRSPMSDVSQDAINAMVLSPSIASVFSAQSDRSSHLSDSTSKSTFGSEMSSVADMSDEQRFKSEDGEEETSIRSPLDSLSVQSSFSCRRILKTSSK